MGARKEAKEQGKTRYFTGKECPRGHISERMVSNGRCCVCTAEDKYKARKANPDKHKDYMRKWHSENQDKEKQYRLQNKERLRQNMRRWRKENPDRDKENRVSWIVRNAGRHRQKSRKWREENRERDRFLNKRWRRNNPGKQKTIMFNRNCATRGVRQAIRHGLIDDMLSSQNWLCNYCSKDIKNGFHVDHKNPVSRGGGNSPENLQLLCPQCNLSKGAKNHIEFLNKLREGVE